MPDKPDRTEGDIYAVAFQGRRFLESASLLAYIRQAAQDVPDGFNAAEALTRLADALETPAATQETVPPIEWN